MKHLKLIAVFLLGIMLIGCATTKPNFAVKEKFWSSKKAVIGVAMVELPKASAHKGGTQGLLDLAINNAGSSDLDAHLATLDISKINMLTKKMASYLKGKGYRVKIIKQSIDAKNLKEFVSPENSGKVHYANQDFRELRSKLGVDKLVLVSVNRIGTIRNYYGFIPTGAPSGLSHLNGQVVDLSSNQLDWNQNVIQTAPNSESDWDVPPAFPGLTKAMYTAIDQSSDSLFNHFAQ